MSKNNSPSLKAVHFSSPASWHGRLNLEDYQEDLAHQQWVLNLVERKKGPDTVGEPQRPGFSPLFGLFKLITAWENLVNKHRLGASK